jgi:hypothetical protein
VKRGQILFPAIEGQSLDQAGAQRVKTGDSSNIREVIPSDPAFFTSRRNVTPAPERKINQTYW